jgi:hypothetical protein
MLQTLFPDQIVLLSPKAAKLQRAATCPAGSATTDAVKSATINNTNIVF